MSDTKGSDCGQWVEIRVHGVSDTPPEDVLGSAFVRQVAGNYQGRIFARANAAGDSQQVTGGRWLEAYHWGQYTSGSWRQGLWLVLIPFVFANAATFMLPRAVKGWGLFWRRLANAMLRLVGLCLTATFAFALGYIVVDVLARQWAPGRVDLLPGPTGLVALGLGATVVALEALYLIPGRQTVRPLTLTKRRRRDVPEPKRPPDQRLDLGNDVDTRLRDRRFFDGDADAPVLRALHRSGAILVVVLLVSRSAIPESLSKDVAQWGLLVVALAVLLLGDPRKQRKDPEPSDRPKASLLRHLLVAAVYLLVIVVVVQIIDQDAGDPIEDPAQLAPFDALALTIISVTVLALVLLLVACIGLAVSTRKTRTAPRAFRPYARGTGAYWVASAGVFLGVGYAAAAAEAAARLLPDVQEKSPVLERVAYAWGVTALLLGATLLVAGACVLYRSKAHKPKVEAIYAGLQGGRGLFGIGPGQVALRVALARVKNWLAPILITFGFAGVVLSLAAGYEMCGSSFTSSLWFSESCNAASGREAWGWFDRLSEEAMTGNFDRLVTLGTWTLSGLATLLLLLGRRAIRLGGTRRGVNVLWDVVSFWPRAAHPLVPPAYSRLVVPELVDRIGHHLDKNPDRRLVVAGHSQGSLIVFAALLWLPPEQLERIGLITYGSQLQTSFSRGFPGYVNVDLLQPVLRALDGRWVNLYRETDPLAGPVLSWQHEGEPHPRSVSMAVDKDWRDQSPTEDRVDPRTGRRSCGLDWRLLDPVPTDEAMQCEPLGPIRAHSDFYADPCWSEAASLVRGVPSPATTGGPSEQPP